jgi:tetratricopeptide (TPR) repeat protein
MIVSAQPNSIPGTPLSSGIRAYQEQRWTDSMGFFLQVLAQDPANEKAHKYLDLLSEQINTERIAKVNETRLAMLSQTSKRLESARMDSTRVDQAINDATQKEVREETQNRHSSCIMAQMEEHLGHLESANDLVLHVIADDPSNVEAQRLLSDLQTDLHNALETKKDVSPAERFALQGFYSYGQADYSAALAAWKQVPVELAKVVDPQSLDHEVALFHFTKYQTIAQSHVDEDDHKQQAQSLFEQGTDLYAHGKATDALESFRKLAILDPDYPQLSKYLVDTEAEVEKERTNKLSDEKKEKSAEALAQGVALLDQNKLADAKAAFGKTLQNDPTNPQAKSYINAADTQLQRRTDPAAAQQHYEAGLIAYAGGKFEDALREWRISKRLDPANTKATNALIKVEREIAMSQKDPL